MEDSYNEFFRRIKGSCMNLTLYANIFGQLLKNNLAIFFKDLYWGDFVDNCIWITAVIITTSYVFPHLGLAGNYGSFYAISTVGSCIFFRLYGNASTFIADLDGEKTITYPLTLPIPSWLLYVQIAIQYAIEAATLSIVVLPLVKILLWTRLDLSHFSLLKFLTIFISFNFFIGFFSILIATMVTKMANILRLWTRILFPLWFFGGSQYSWHTMYALSSKLAYLSLLNPLLYAYEALHAAALGQEGYLSFWRCFITLWACIILCGVWGFVRLKRRLDFV